MTLKTVSQTWPFGEVSGGDMSSYHEGIVWPDQQVGSSLSNVPGIRRSRREDGSASDMSFALEYILRTGRQSESLDSFGPV